MRSIHHKLFSSSRVSVNYFFRKLFWIVFLFCLGFIIGALTGLYKQISKLSKDDITATIILVTALIVSFILWITFMKAHRKRLQKEEICSIIEYLEELRDNGALFQEVFLKEKEKFTNQYPI